MLPLLNFLCYNQSYERNMKNKFLVFLCSITASSASFAAVGVVRPAQYQNANGGRVVYNTSKNYTYPQYVGNSGQRQVTTSRTYSYPVARQQLPSYPGTTTTNGIAQPVDKKTSI